MAITAIWNGIDLHSHRTAPYCLGASCSDRSKEVLTICYPTIKLGYCVQR